MLQLASDVDDEFKELNSTLDDFQMHTMKYAAAALASRYPGVIYLIFNYYIPL